MVAKVNALGRSFAGVAAYCLHDAREEGESRPESADRVEWADTRRLTSRIDRAAAQMAATANAAPELKRLAGVSAAGRKLAKPVLHYSLSWSPQDRVPTPPEMRKAVDESLRALGLDRHQALIVAHNDTAHPHVHVIANRVDPETGKAATLDRSHLRLSQWAERWERDRTGIRCPERVTNNAARARGETVRDRKSLHTARHRRERMRPLTPRAREPRQGRELDYADLQRRWANLERQAWYRYKTARPAHLARIAPGCRSDWREQFEHQRAEEAGAKSLARGSLADRLRLANIEADPGWYELRYVRPRQETPGRLAGLRAAWRETWREKPEALAGALGLRRAIAVARINPGEHERSALAKLARWHRVERAEICEYHGRLFDGDHRDQPSEVYKAAVETATWNLYRAQRDRLRPPRPRYRAPEPVREPDRDRGGVDFSR